MKKSMKKLLSLGLAIAMAASLTACGSGKASEGTTAAGTETKGEAQTTAAGGAATGEGTIKIGGIGPISGSTAIYGQAVKNGAELAVNEINANGGINGAKIEFNFQDDENDTEKSVNAYNTLKDWVCSYW